MAGSGRLAVEIAEAFDIPHSNVTTVVKALRADRLIKISGRGSSAAQMTANDAITMIVGIASASATAEVSKVTQLLVKMPLRHTVRQGWSDIAIKLAPHVLSLPDPHPFQDGFQALFNEEWTDHSERENSGNMELFNPMVDVDAVRVTIGVNGHRTAGFAVIEARVTEGKKLKNFYSTLPRRPDLKKDDDPGGLGLSLYQPVPSFAFSAVLDGRGLVKLASVLAAPVAESRKRGHRKPAKK